MTIEVKEHAGARSELRPLFELAEDSALALDSYIDAGRVLVVVEGGRAVGHLQQLGFRMREIERDAFTPANGYAEQRVDGIELRDRVWLDLVIA